MNNYQESPSAIGITAIVSLFIIFLIVAFGSWEIVSAGYRGVYVRAGSVQDRSLQAGFHWKLPFVDTIKEINVQTQKDEVQADSASRDLQQVTATIALNYRIQPDQAHNLYKDIGMDYQTRIIAPAIEEAVKAATAKYNAEELITKRSEVKETAKQQLKAQLAPFNILLEEFSIVDFSFSQEFDRAIEAKVTAEQRALEAENNLKRVEFEQQAEIEKAKALAKKSELEALALQNNAAAANLTKKIEAEATLEFARKWNGQLPNNWVIGGTIADKLMNKLAQ